MRHLLFVSFSKGWTWKKASESSCLSITKWHSSFVSHRCNSEPKCLLWTQPFHKRLTSRNATNSNIILLSGRNYKTFTCLVSSTSALLPPQSLQQPLNIPKMKPSTSHLLYHPLYATPCACTTTWEEVEIQDWTSWWCTECSTQTAAHSINDHWV